jgi:hypothetical protein
MKTFVATLRGEVSAVRVHLEADNIRHAQDKLDLWLAGWIASGHRPPPEVVALAEVSRPREAISLFSPEGWEKLK